MRKIIREIKHRLHFHNPKTLFCSHRYNASGSEGTRYGAFTYYTCEKCGKNIALQTYREVVRQRD